MGVTPESGPRAVAPPSNFAALDLLLASPHILKDIWEECRRVYEPFPEGGSGLFAWLALNRAGFNIPYGFGVARQVATLQQSLRVVPAHLPPRRLDLFVITDRKGVPAEVGFVAQSGKALQSETFNALDPGMQTEGKRAFRPYRRRIDGGPDGEPVGFWLRCPTCQEPADQQDAE